MYPRPSVRLGKRIVRAPLLLLSAMAGLALLASACSPRPATPTPDVAGTVAAVAYDLMTQTAAAAPPTASPTATATPLPPDTPTPNVTVTPEHSMPMVANFAGCYFGPGVTYTLESNISKGRRVELLGVGSEAGWYIIRNPYFHRPCWIAVTDLEIDPGVNTVDLPVMTPGAPLPGK